MQTETTPTPLAGSGLPAAHCSAVWDRYFCTALLAQMSSQTLHDEPHLWQPYQAELSAKMADVMMAERAKRIHPGSEWFSNDPQGNGMVFHSTEAAARSAAEAAMEAERIAAGEDHFSGWSDTVTEICWGRIIQRAGTVPAQEGFEDYALTPPTSPAARSRASRSSASMPPISAGEAAAATSPASQTLSPATAAPKCAP